MKKIIILFITALLIFSSCEKTVIIDVPETEPKLTAHAWVGKGDVIIVQVGKSRHILSPHPNYDYLNSYIVKDATVVLYENDVVYDNLVYDANDYKYKSPTGKTIRGGYTYTLKINAPGFKEAEAITVVPTQSTITEVQRVRNAGTNSYGNEVDDITLKFDDPLEKNFYLIKIYGGYFGSQYPLYCINTTDKDIESMGEVDPFDPEPCFDGDRLLMKDVNFNGNQKQVKFRIESQELQEYTDPTTGRIMRPYIKLYRITEDYFKYIKTLNAFEMNDGNPFAEPSNVYSNLKNGYGIFSAYTVAVDTLR